MTSSNNEVHEQGSNYGRSGSHTRDLKPKFPTLNKYEFHNANNKVIFLFGIIMKLTQLPGIKWKLLSFSDGEKTVLVFSDIIKYWFHFVSNMPQEELLCMGLLNILFTTMKCCTAYFPTEKFVSKFKKKGNRYINDFILVYYSWTIDLKAWLTKNSTLTPAEGYFLGGWCADYRMSYISWTRNQYLHSFPFAKTPC